MTSLQGNFGWMGPSPIDILVTNRTGTSMIPGDVVQIDNRRIDAASSNNTPGSPNAGISNVIIPTLIELGSGIFGACLQSAIDDGIMRIRLSGQCDAVRVAGTVVLATDNQYTPEVSTTLLRHRQLGTAVTGSVKAGDAAVGNGSPLKVVFIPLTARTGAGTTDGWFDGVSGFGTVLWIDD